MQVDATNVKTHLCLALEERLQLADDVLEARLGVFSTSEVAFTVPIINQHEHLLLVHAERVGLAHHILLKQLEEFVVREVGELHVNSLVTLLAHASPQLGLRAHAFFGSLMVQSLQQLVATKHMATHVHADLLLLDNLMVELELAQLTAIRVMHEVEAVRTRSREATAKDAVAFRVLEDEVDVDLVALSLGHERINRLLRPNHQVSVIFLEVFLDRVVRLRGREHVAAFALAAQSPHCRVATQIRPGSQLVLLIEQLSEERIEQFLAGANALTISSVLELVCERLDELAQGADLFVHFGFNRTTLFFFHGIDARLNNLKEFVSAKNDIVTNIIPDADQTFVRWFNRNRGIHFKILSDDRRELFSLL